MLSLPWHVLLLIVQVVAARRVEPRVGARGIAKQCIRDHTLSLPWGLHSANKIALTPACVSVSQIRDVKPIHQVHGNRIHQVADNDCFVPLATRSGCCGCCATAPQAPWHASAQNGVLPYQSAIQNDPAGVIADIRG